MIATRASDLKFIEQRQNKRVLEIIPNRKSREPLSAPLQTGVLFEVPQNLTLWALPRGISDEKLE